MTPRAPDADGGRVRRLLIRLCVGVTTALGLILFANALAFVLLGARDHFWPQATLMSRYTPDILARTYPSWTSDDVRQLFTETYEPLEYQPYTGFRQRPIRGRFVNIVEPGFRVGKNQGVWPPDSAFVNVWMFGGSTTFGIGVPDEDAIPSRAQERLSVLCGRPVRVYNFGRDSYFSTQERILFERLVTLYPPPSAAVFVDGLNDAWYEGDSARFAAEFARLFEFAQHSRHSANGVSIALSGSSLGRLWRGVKARLVPASQPDEVQSNAVQPEKVRRWLVSRALISSAARSQNIEPMFVIQPVPVYRYDLAAHPFAQTAVTELRGVPRFYELLNNARGTAAMTDVVWLADVQAAQGTKDLYVDPVHYSAHFTAVLGGMIADSLASRLTICRRSGADAR